MSFTIVPSAAQDAAELDQLVNSAYRGESSRQGWTTEADLLDGTRTDATAIEAIIRQPGHQILKYVEDGTILGCVEIRNDQDRLYLGMLTVRPHLQGKGIGKELMKAAESEGKKLKCTSVYMTVISERAELIDWYKRHGYSDTGERKPFHFNDPRFGQPKKQLEFAVLEKNI
jgi:ribosomal protein S18 acetylase RimI-like enzyme